VLEVQSLRRLRQQVYTRMGQDYCILEVLRDEVRPLRERTRRIRPRSATSISIVAADGGNNSLQFDPFLAQVVRVVDSSNNEYCLEIVTPTTDVQELGALQFGEDGKPRSALGQMMASLGVRELPALSHMIRVNQAGEPTSPTWIQVYRELVEWAILLALVRERDYGTDTLIIHDGLLRSKVFARDLFARYSSLLTDAIKRQWVDNRRRIYLVGLAKHSKVLSRYRLAMRLERVLWHNYPCYVEIPRELEEKAYVWSEYARGDDRNLENITEVNKFVAGKMFFVKFGGRPADPVWPVDILISQIDDASIIIGYLLADALNGFPVPFYPLSLQRAHELAALVDFDFEILQDMVFDGIREALGSDSPVLDSFRLQDSNPSQRRY